MARISMNTIRNLNEGDLKDRLQQARSELGKLKIEAAKGTLRKDSGKIRPLRRDVARMMTRLHEVQKE